MMYFAALVTIFFVYGIIIWASSQAELTPEVRKNMAPEDIETIHEELQWRRHVGLLMILISMFPIMTYLWVYF